MNKLELYFVSIFLLLLAYAGYLSYKSIDFDVLKKLETQNLILPSPPTAIPSQNQP